MHQARRFSLSLTDAQLDALRSATDVALNVPAAEATERAFGRVSALSHVTRSGRSPRRGASTRFFAHAQAF